MNSKLFGALWGFVIAGVTWMLMFFPLFGLGCWIFPYKRPDGHNVMPIAAAIFALFFTTIIGLLVWFVAGNKLYKRHLSR